MDTTPTEAQALGLKLLVVATIINGLMLVIGMVSGLGGYGWSLMIFVLPTSICGARLLKFRNDRHR